MNRAYELIVFDWDGTLMDSAAKIVRCFQCAAADAGLPPPPDHAIRNIIGLGLKEALDLVLPGTDDTVREQVVACYRRHFIHLDNTETPLFPGVREGLDKLAAAGYRLAIATGKARRGLDRVLRDTAISHYFCATRCADEARSKPHPQMLHDLLDCTGVPAERAVMIGDTTYDLQMAAAAAVGGVAVTYGAHERERLLAHKPLGCFDSFGGLCDWLQPASS
ncbi:MAG: HAD-IA family hydrolase [Sulfurifustis sp.]